MSRILLLALILLLLINCSSSLKKNYSGYFYYGDQPLKRVKVTEQYTNNYTYTDDKGYFELKRNSLKQVNDLIIRVDDITAPDTIQLLRGGAAGSKRDYLFISDRIDTCDIERERVFKQQSR